MTQMIVLTSQLNLRSGPGSTSSVIGTMRWLQAVEGIESDGDWIKVSAGGQIGWAFGQYLAEATKEGLTIGFTLAEEGSFTDIKHDPGNWTGGQIDVGELKGTKYGISAFAYPQLDIRNLTLSSARSIYRVEWYFRPGFDQVEWPLCMFRMDTAVNCGLGGEATVHRNAKFGEADSYLEERRNYYRSLRNFCDFGEAWLKRVDRMGELARAISLSE